MDEHKVFMVELGGLFPEFDDAPKVHGTAGEILERVADEMGIEDGDATELDYSPDGTYPSIRAYRAQLVLEDRLHSPNKIANPDELIALLIKEGLVRPMTDAEFDEWQDELEMDEYEEARSGLDEEWQDGLWEK